MMDLLEVGEIVNTRGLQGCMKVRSCLETAGIFNKIQFLYVEEASGNKKPFNIRKIDRSGKMFFVQLEKISDVETARGFIGRKVYLPRDILEILPEGEYYCDDVIGIDVYTEEGEHIGKIESIFPTGSNDVYVCRGKREILIPAIAEVIKEINVQKKIMKVKLMAGL
jgi:16S rRNA processing protein RimM